MTATETLTRPSTTSPPKVMDLHILDKDSEGQPAEKTLCGLAWDRLNPKRSGPLCKECERIVTERGHGHLLPFIGRAPGGGVTRAQGSWASPARARASASPATPHRRTSAT